MRTPLSAIAFISAALVTPLTSHAQRAESLWYMRNSDSQVADFAAHARQIDIIAPQVYGMDSTGAIRGGVDPRTVSIAKANGVKLHPLVMNPGFSVTILHQILTDKAARPNALRQLAALCRDNKFDGIQLDFENLYTGDRDAFTSFARDAADSVHRAGCQLSAAVVPRTDDDRGVTAYHHWLYDYWRGPYDYTALADALDFISYMTYAQHTGSSTPGPVAGYDWMVRSLDYALKAGVPRNKLSLGLASYSDHWVAGYDWRNGARTQARDIEYTTLMSIIAKAGAEPQWDKRQHAWYAMWEDHQVFEHAWIEDARAFQDKRALVDQHALRGYSVWVLGTEDPEVWDKIPARR